MWFLVGATSCHEVFSGGHILPCGFYWGPHLAMWFLVGATSRHVVLVGATFCHVVFSGGHVVFSGGHVLPCGFFMGATSWSAIAAPRQGRPPSPPGKLFLRVPERQSPPGSLAGPARVRSLTTPPSIGSIVGIPACLLECVVGLLRRVVRGPRQGRPPSPPGWPAKLVLGMWFLVGATSWNVDFSGGHILPFSGGHILPSGF